MDNLIDFDTFSMNESYVSRINKDVTVKPGDKLGTYNVYDKGKFIKTVGANVLKQMKKAHSRFTKDFDKPKKKEVKK